MNYEMFIKEVVKKTKEIFCENDNEYVVSVNHVIKNNGIKLDGLVILKEDQRISPNIYLNSFYDMYKQGERMDSIVNKIIEIYYSSRDNEIIGRFDLDYDFENIRDKIVYKVVNFNRNRELLKDSPYMKFLNLAIIFQCVINVNQEGIAAIRITNNHCKTWGISTKDLINIAMVNTPKMFPVILRNMQDVVKEIVLQSEVNIFEREIDTINCVEEDNSYHFKDNKIEDEVIEEMIDKVSMNTSMDMYVLSNTYGINGASTILYNGVLDRFARRIEKDLYILPSSIHEVIVIPKMNDLEPDKLKEMISEINETQVPDEDILADSLYEYSRKSKAINLV